MEPRLRALAEAHHDFVQGLASSAADMKGTHAQLAELLDTRTQPPDPLIAAMAAWVRDIQGQTTNVARFTNAVATYLLSDLVAEGVDLPDQG